MASAALQIQNLSKSFGIVRALSDVSMSVQTGEIRALVGENGAGKSTLIKIVSGALRPDTGQLLLDGRIYTPRNTHEAHAHGVSTMYQESESIGNLTVAENIFIGHEQRVGPLLRMGETARRASRLLRRYSIDIDPGSRMDNLSPSEAKLVEMARAVNMNAKIMILDEPTANLNEGETRILFGAIRQLQEENIAVIYISHRIPEIFELCENVTVLRDGHLVETLKVADTDADSVVEKMIGRRIENYYPKIGQPREKPVLSIRKLNTKLLEDVSFDIRSGEVYGLYGLAGSGVSDVIAALYGLSAPRGGEIELLEKPYASRNPKTANERGVFLVPDDRKTEGLMLNLDVMHNMIIGSLRKYSRGGWIRTRRARTDVMQAINQLNIKPPDHRLPVRSLSGGNQQKVVIGKWIGQNCSLMILHEPTRGIDVGAKIEVYGLLNELSRTGIAVLVVSSEVMELMGICHRIGVVSNGRIAREFNRGDFNERDIVTSALPA